MGIFIIKGNEFFDEQTGLIKPHVIELGLIDVMYAQVIDGVKEGQQLISEFIASEKVGAPKGRPRM